MEAQELTSGFKNLIHQLKICCDSKLKNTSTDGMSAHLLFHINTKCSPNFHKRGTDFCLSRPSCDHDTSKGSYLRCVTPFFHHLESIWPLFLFLCHAPFECSLSGLKSVAPFLENCPALIEAFLYFL